MARRGAVRWVRLSGSWGASGLPSGGSVVGAGDEMRAWLAVAPPTPGSCPPEAGDPFQQPSRFTEKGRPGTVGQLDSEPGLTTGCTPRGSARCCTWRGAQISPHAKGEALRPSPPTRAGVCGQGAWSAGGAGPRLPGPAPRIFPRASGEEVPGTRCVFWKERLGLVMAPRDLPCSGLGAGSSLCPCQGHLPGWVGKSGLPSLGGTWCGARRGPQLA